MNTAKLVEFQQRIGYSFNDLDILKRAFIHASADGDDNDRLEFLGDAALGFVVSELMYRRLSESDAGTLTAAKVSLINNDLLAEIALELGIDRLMSVGTSITNNDQSGSKVYADALEAVIGAMFVDGGMEPVQEFVDTHIATDVTRLKGVEKHPKSTLQEWAASRGYCSPSYDVVAHKHVTGGEHWQVTCTIEGAADAAHGEGRSKREAETNAANTLLKELTHARV